ncbi:growth-regulating factor 9 isoform X2 [Eutrema salsugineum]|nr:growth-regulating factor 9 isoform X2 [Eutrema salsugineum]
MEEEEEERRKKKWPWMKAAQLLEFQMQALVYRYIEAGLRVPHHLVVPIWNSLALSSSSSSYLIHQNHHSSSLLSAKVEPEPTRCRRTDGKKWRCSNKVLLFQKYCERHMHRGRKRSRKLVESSSYVVVSSPASTKHDNTYGLDSSNESQNVFHGTMSASNNAQVVTIASLPSARVCDNTTRPSLVITESTNKSMSHGVKSRRTVEMSYDDFIKQRDSSTCVRVVPVQGDERLPSVQKFFPEASDNFSAAAKFSSNRKNEIIARSREWKNMNVNGGFPGIHFSPDTVLQGRGGFRLHRVETDNEPGRCRRTDGKKWRCSKVALSGQKYCDKHMHRGIKKKHRVDTTNSHDNAGFTPLTVKTAARSLSCKDGDDQKLSVSVLGIPLPRVSDEKSTSSCSTDTTITDTALRGEEDNEEVLSLCSSGV